MSKLYLSPILIGIILMGCASVTVLPQGKNTFTVVAISSSQSDALEAGMKKAYQTCQPSGSTLKVLENNTQYTGGADRTVKETLSAVSTIATGKYVSSHDRDDYTVTIKFKCI